MTKRYRSAVTGKFISYQKAIERNEKIYRVDTNTFQRQTKAFKPPPPFTGIRFRDESGKLVTSKKAGNRNLRAEIWRDGKRIEEGIKRFREQDEVDELTDAVNAEMRQPKDILDLNQAIRDYYDMEYPDLGENTETLELLFGE